MNKKNLVRSIVIGGLSLLALSFAPLKKHDSGISLRMVYYFNILDTRKGLHIQDYDNPSIVDTLHLELSDSELHSIVQRAKDDSIFVLPDTLIGIPLFYPPKQSIRLQSRETGVKVIKWAGPLGKATPKFLKLRNFCEYVDTVVHHHPGYTHPKSPG